MLEAERDLTLSLSQAPVPVATAGDAKKLLYLRVFVGKVHYQRGNPLYAYVLGRWKAVRVRTS